MLLGKQQTTCMSYFCVYSFTYYTRIYFLACSFTYYSMIYFARHDITEILLKVVLNTINLYFLVYSFHITPGDISWHVDLHIMPGYSCILGHAHIHIMPYFTPSLPLVTIWFYDWFCCLFDITVTQGFGFIFNAWFICNFQVSHFVPERSGGEQRTKATNGRYRPCKLIFFQNERRNVLYSQKFPSGIEVYRVWSNYIIWRIISEF